MQFEHVVGSIVDEGRYDDEKFVFLRVGFTDIIDDGHVVGFGLFQIVGAFVTHFK